MIPYKTLVGMAREAGTLEAFGEHCRGWSLLVKAPPAVSEDDAPDVETAFAPTMSTKRFKEARDKLLAQGGDAGSEWPDLWVAWMVPRHAGGQVLTLGRAPAADVVIRHPSVSSLHLILVPLEDGGWQVCDQGSSNGTQLNGVQLPRGSFLKIQTGDVLGISKLVEATVLSPEALFERASSA